MPERTPTARTVRPRDEAASRPGLPKADRRPPAAGAYRTRRRGRASCRMPSAWPQPWAGFPPPTESPCDRGARPAGSGTARQRNSARALRPGEQALQGLAKLRAVERVGQREFHETLEIAWEVADIVALLSGVETNRHHAP